MIDEATGKILGMAMAYCVSGLGLLLAYVNYRRRNAPGEPVISRTAWAVLTLVLLVTAGGAVTVWHLGARAAAEPPPVVEAAPVEAPALEPVAPRSASRQEEPSRWPLVGIVVPAAIFFIATWVTASLHRHFSRT